MTDLFEKTKIGDCDLVVAPIARKGAFTIKSSELGDNWSARHHAMLQAVEFSWELRVGCRGDVFGKGVAPSPEQAKNDARKFLAEWAKTLCGLVEVI